MPTNVAAQFTSDVENYIQDELLPLAARQLVVYQFGVGLKLPKGRGTTYTASRYNRLPLPYTSLSEGVPPVGELMTLSQVSAVALQWGDKVTITDVGEMTIKHPLFKTAANLASLQVIETLERNTFNAILAFPQVNYVNSRGSRAALQAGDVLDPHTVNRTTAALETIGALRFMGDERTDDKILAQSGADRASENPRTHPHYVGVIHPLVVQDFRENSIVVTAWSYSDLNRLYNSECGEWGGIRFCKTNMVPSWTGLAAIQGTPSTTGGSLATGTYYIIVTYSDTQNQYESQICQVSNAITVTGPTGSISVNITALTGYTANVYIGTSNTPTNLATTNSGPVVGPLTGQAVQLTPGTTVTLTGVGVSQTPPAAPQTGITVYPTFVFGRDSYGQVELDDVSWSYLTGADKSDPLNQLRVIGWKVFYGTILLNTTFAARIESSSAFSATFG